MEKYDAVLYVTNPINEEENDQRIYNKGKTPSVTKGYSQYWYNEDPKMYNSYTFGNAVRQNLNSLGQGFSCQVVDFKKWVVVTVTHSNVVTGKSASKTFLIVFQEDGDGVVLSTHNRYRSISGAGQACSYIRSVCNSLQNDTQIKMG